MTDRPKLTLKTKPASTPAPATPQERKRASKQRMAEEHAQAAALVGLSVNQLRQPGPAREHLRDVAWATLHLNRIATRGYGIGEPWFARCQEGLACLQQALQDLPKGVMASPPENASKAR